MRYVIRVFFLLALVKLLVQPAHALVRPWESSLPEQSKFTPSAELRDRVEFWVRIYSHYTTSQGVFHLVHSPERVLGEVDFTAIQNNSVLSAPEKRRRIDQLLAKKRNEIQKRHGLSPSQFRFQAGLKDRMEKAFFEAGKYLPMMERIFKEQGLPVELTRIVFVESSFNIRAQSKVGASGLWQIMPFVAKPKGYIQKDYDKRNHPYYATKLAAEIFKQNYHGLKSWPLAVTAYNHGLTGVRRMKAKADSRDLADLIDSEQRTRSWGFASENFYVCFLAVLEVERRAESLFGDRLLAAAPLLTKNIRLERAIPKSKVLKAFGGSLSRLKSMNPHIRWARFERKKVLPAGLPLIIPHTAQLTRN